LKVLQTSREFRNFLNFIEEKERRFAASQFQSGYPKVLPKASLASRIKVRLLAR